MSHLDSSSLGKLNARIVECQKCPRLREYCGLVAKRKKKAFANWDYWSKPLPGFGDICAKLLVVGLGPAAHGGTRTGRMFCGDSSGDWLVKALYETGFANQSPSVSRSDGLELRAAYITAIVRCAPPQNRPTPEERQNCLPYLQQEMTILRDLKIVLTLGRIAFENFLTASAHVYRFPTKPHLEFRHGARYKLGEGLPTLYSSYHPSRQNTQTRRLTWSMWIEIFRRIRRELSPQ